MMNSNGKLVNKLYNNNKNNNNNSMITIIANNNPQTINVKITLIIIMMGINGILLTIILQANHINYINDNMYLKISTFHLYLTIISL